jgi:hypothetical protein
VVTVGSDRKLVENSQSYISRSMYVGKFLSSKLRCHCQTDDDLLQYNTVHARSIVKTSERRATLTYSSE